MLINNRNSLHLWRLESPRLGLWHIQYLVRTCLLVHRHCLLTVSTHEGMREFSGASFRRALIPIMRASSSFTPQKPHFLTPSHWVLGFQHMKSGGHRHSDHSTMRLTDSQCTISVVLVNWLTCVTITTINFRKFL